MLIIKKKIDEDFDLYTVIELKNKKPIAMEYKSIKLLGDKVQIQVADNKRAQDLWYFALGVGLGEMNARGCGFFELSLVITLFKRKEEFYV